MLEKNLERKDAQAGKKRESILVVANKTKDALSTAEDRIKQLQFEQQRLHMDLTARTCECSVHRHCPTAFVCLPLPSHSRWQSLIW
jgi:UDP-N-acetylglucosamine 2-epimerase